MSNKIAVGDADSFHIRAQKTGEWLLSLGYEIVYPNTAILEAMTALKRSLNLADEAHLINRQYQAGVFTVEFIDEEIQWRASQRFDRTNSKKNTIFDAVVAETAAKLEADYIFSFDTWFPKEGFTLAEVQEDGV